MGAVELLSWSAVGHDLRHCDDATTLGCQAAATSTGLAAACPRVDRRWPGRPATSGVVGERVTLDRTRHATRTGPAPAELGPLDRDHLDPVVPQPCGTPRPVPAVVAVPYKSSQPGPFEVCLAPLASLRSVTAAGHLLSSSVTSTVVWSGHFVSLHSWRELTTARPAG